jgi:hypothetical protein
VHPALGEALAVVDAIVPPAIALILILAILLGATGLSSASPLPPLGLQPGRAADPRGCIMRNQLDESMETARIGLNT